MKVIVVVATGSEPAVPAIAFLPTAASSAGGEQKDAGNR